MGVRASFGAGLTPSHTRFSWRFVSRFRKILALVLALIWLPAAQHCMLEASEILSEQGDHASHSTCCNSDAGICNAEACSLVESGNYEPGLVKLAAPAPVLIFSTILFCHLAEPKLPVDVGASISIGKTFERPEDFHPVWQFTQRAAPQPRAPSLTLA